MNFLLSAEEGDVSYAGTFLADGTPAAGQRSLVVEN
jgi:hypothetical protein